MAKLLQICLSKSWGGLEMVTLETAQAYHARGVFVRTVCQPGSRLESQLLQAGLPYFSLRARNYFDPAAVSALHRVLREDEITAVVLQQLKDIWHARPALIGLPNVQLIGFAHIFLGVRKRGIGHRWLYGRMDRLICLTDIQKRNFAEHLPIDPLKIEVIPNAVDTSIFRPENRSVDTRKSLGAEDGDFLVGVIGRLDESKGQLEIVEAARALKAEGLRIKVVLVGEETLNLMGTKARLEEKIASDQLGDTVRLTGFRSDIPQIIASLDVLAMPSWAETFGRVLLEAMASKTPVIATSAGGVPDIVADGVTGLLIPPRDSEALRLAIRRFLRDAALMKSCSETAYQQAQAVYDHRKVQVRLDEILLASTSADTIKENV